MGSEPPTALVPGSVCICGVELLAVTSRPISSPTVKDDAQLIDEALAGDSGAFGELVCKYQNRLYNTIVHVVGCTEEARDVVQDAFVQAFLKLDTFQRSSAFFTWLYRIAFNTSVSRHRRRKPSVSIDEAREISGHEPVDGGAEPDAPMQQEELACRVRHGLAALSDEHRTVMVLREIEGFSYETIAELLEVPIGTVRSRIHRARVQLRDELKEVLQEEHGA